MVQRATSITPAVLVWARERAGFSVTDVATRLGKEPADITAWERGDAFPAYGQLESLAETYRRPVALFFLPEPPDEAPPQNQFRTLPDADLASLGPDTRYALRDAHAYQTSLRELTGGRNPAERRILADLRWDGTGVEAFAHRVRDYLAVPLATQQRWPNAEIAMEEWRASLEQVGVFVFKRSFKDRVVSGFCLHDPEFPVIVVNNSTPFTRQVFTLIHELAHLLLGESSIDKADPGFIGRFNDAGRQVEIACNRFAGEFLVPDASVGWAAFAPDNLDWFLEATAHKYNVSREVVMRRLLDRGLVTNAQYLAKVAEWANDPARDGGGGEGGSYYATQSAYLSKAFTALVFGLYRAGRISLPETSEHLGMKARSVVKFEDYLFARG
jgi:Zn-dependent peptidase ImmA (M78 family)